MRRDRISDNIVGIVLTFHNEKAIDVPKEDSRIRALLICIKSEYFYKLEIKASLPRMDKEESF